MIEGTGTHQGICPSIFNKHRKGKLKLSITAIRNENITAYLVNSTSDVRIKSDSGSLDVTVFDAKTSEVASTLERHLNMSPKDAQYVAKQVGLYEGFKFHSNDRFVYGDMDDIKRLLQEQGRDMARDLEQSMGVGITTYGVYYSVNARLRRFGALAASSALAQKMKAKAEEKHPTGIFVVVGFTGPRNITVDGARL